MNGSIHQDKRSGKYCIKLYLEGKQVCICTDKHTGGSFSSKAHAVKVLGVIQSEIDAGAFSRDEWRQGAVSPKKTVKWYASIWLENRKKMAEKGLLVPSTVIDNTTNVKRYILPRFARRALSSITAKDILEFKGSISRSPAGVSNVLGTLQKMLNDAAEEGLAPSVPKFPSMTKKSLEPKKSLSIDIQDRILDSIPFQDRAIFQFLVEYGVRPGEARGLLKGILKFSSVTPGSLHRPFFSQRPCYSGA